MISQAILVTMVMLLLDTGKCWEPEPMPICPTIFGDPTVPFPFGTSSSCNLDYSFLITCNYSYNPPKPFLSLGSMEVRDISLDGKITVASSLASHWYGHSGSQINNSTSGGVTLSEVSMPSTRNMDPYRFIQLSEEWNKMSAGCVSWFDNVERVMYRSCSVIDCWRPSVPVGITDFPVNIRSFRNLPGVHRFSSCDYVFVLETDHASENSSSDLKNPVPNILDWSVGNLSCHEVEKSLLSLACRATHSECIDSSIGAGYNCKCSTGFQGDPYLVDGCHRDIDECVVSESFTNLINGKEDGFAVPAICISWIIWSRKQKKVVKLRRNLFIRNGGELLEAMQSFQKTLSVFTAEDLKKATNNYDEINVLCQEHHLGFTYKGILPGVNCNVTIQFCHAFDRCNTGILISNLVAFSQICHRNVVKLLGCCLETQIPLLVYEFVPYKTLLDHINAECLARSLSWDIRLRIAADTAGALAYLHSATTGPIIHGSLNSSCILLDHAYTVKVNGFALTCSECFCVGFSDAVTSSCLNPDYVSSAQFTEKSDVYSYGLILAELLTGKSVMSPEWLQGEENLAKYFVGSSRGGELLGILDDRLVTDDDNLCQLTQVAEIAKRCLSSSSQERPTIKEVSIALECLIFRDHRLSLN